MSEEKNVEEKNVEEKNVEEKNVEEKNVGNIELPQGVREITIEEFEKTKPKRGKWGQLIELVKKTNKALEIKKLDGEDLTEGQVGAGLRAFGRAGLKARRVTYIENGKTKYKILVAP